MSQQDELGVRALNLLAAESMVAVLGSLADGALRPAELDRLLPDVAHSVVMRRLRHLLDSELVTYEHRPGQPPHALTAPIPHEARYDLTDAARMLLEVTAEANHWEQTWCSKDERREPAGTLAIKLTADEHTRKIGLLLADGALSTKDLDRHAPDLCRSALRRRLRELVLAGLLERRARGRNSLYELTARARHLAHVATLAGRWEWQWSRPQHPTPGTDLHKLLHMLAPVAHLPEPLTASPGLSVGPAIGIDSITRGGSAQDQTTTLTAGSSVGSVQRIRRGASPEPESTQRPRGRLLIERRATEAISQHYTGDDTHEEVLVWIGAANSGGNVRLGAVECVRDGTSSDGQFCSVRRVSAE